MATATIGALKVVLGLDFAQFENGLTAAQKHLRGVGKQMEGIGRNFQAVGATLSLAVTAPLIAAGFAASKAATEAVDAMGQVEAALTSMGAASGRTAEQLGGLAEGLMRNSLYDDDEILRKVTANLLTFGNVAGAQFDRAQQAAVDLATRMEGDLQGATLMVGKALNDPVKGLAALGRAGIQFTAQQKDQIKAMVAVGNVAGAQSLMLSELERQFGGAAAAAQATDPYDKLRDALNSLSESAGAILNRTLTPLAEKVAALADKFNGLSPQMQGFAVAGLAIAAALGPALVIIGTVVGALGSLTTALASGGVLAGLGAFAVAAVPFVAAGAAIAAAVWLFKDDLEPILREFGAAAMAALGPPIQSMIQAAGQAFSALGPLMSALGPVVKVIGEALMWAFGPIVVRALQILVAGLTNAFNIIGAAIRVVTAVLTGDWAGAWEATGSLVMSIVRGIGNIVEAVFPGIGRVVGRMVNEVTGFLGRQLGAVFDGVISKVRFVGDAFHTLWDRVVGHSYIPDLVEGVAAWMARLDQGMVKPAADATKKVGDDFEALRDRVARVMEGLLTEREQLARAFASEMADIDAGERGGLLRPDAAAQARARTRANNARDNAGLDAEGLSTGPNRDAPSFDFLEPFNRTMDRMNKAIADSRDKFADAFAGGMEAAMRGDWQGVLRSIFGDIVGNSLRKLGASLFDMGGGGKGGGFNLGSIISSAFGGMKGFKIPGFANEGTIKPGGAGGVDSQLVSFWKSPNEQVDIYKPGNDRGASGGTKIFDMRGAVVTEQIMRDVNAQVAAGEARVRRDMPTVAVRAVSDARQRAHG